MKDYQTYQIAHFVHQSNYEILDYSIVSQLKKHLLDSIASLIHAKDRPTIKKLSRQIQQTAEGLLAMLRSWEELLQTELLNFILH